MKQIFYLILLCIPMLVSAQYKKIKSLEVSEPIQSTYIDRTGDFYVQTQSGQLQKFDKNGIVKFVYKTLQAPTLFEPRDGSRLFVYYRNTRLYSYLNPSFEVIASYKIDSTFVIDPWLACTAGEYNLWVIDKADHTLKKINPRTSTIEVEVALAADSINNVTALREYQGFVFVLEEHKGIMVFNGMGKLIKTIDGTAIKQFNFLGEELYFTERETLKLFDLFSGESRTLTLPNTCTTALLTDERLLLIQDKTVDLFELKP